MVLERKLKVALLVAVGLAVLIAVMVSYLLLNPVRLIEFTRQNLFTISIFLAFLFVGLGFMSRWLLKGETTQAQQV